MKRIKVNLEKITEFDLKLAENDQILTLLDEIIPLSLEERRQRLQTLQTKIQQGTASLFEERVLVILLENRKAEWIRVIHKNLAHIEAEFKKRDAEKRAPASDASAAVPSSSLEMPSTQPDEYPSELLTFLATQKPLTPPVKSSKQRNGYAVDTRTKKRPFMRVRDVVIVALFGSAMILAFLYTISSKKSPPPPTTFDQQTTAPSGQPTLSDEALQHIQTRFDQALQELRFGDFEHGKTQMGALIQEYPHSSQAEDAYIAIADTYRQRQDNPDEALKSYQLFTETYPASSKVGLTQLKMGFAYEDMEDQENAAKMYRLVLSQHGARSRLGQLASERLSGLTEP